MAEGGTEPKSIDSQISKGQLEINECLGNWLTYLQVSDVFSSISMTLRREINHFSHYRHLMAYAQLVLNWPNPCKRFSLRMTQWRSVV